jgi:hypothetical protein
MAAKQWEQYDQKPKGNIIQVRTVTVELDNETTQTYHFNEYADGACSFRSMFTVRPQIILPVAPNSDNFTISQIRAIYILWLLVSYPEGEVQKAYVPYFKGVLNILMTSTPPGDRKMTKQKFKESVFEIWDAEFFCTDSEVVLYDLVKWHMPHWEVAPIATNSN